MTARIRTDDIIGQYLSRLETALRDLPAERRRPIIEEVAEHIASGRASLDPADEAGLRALLDRVGDPEAIAAEAAADAPARRPSRRDAWVPWLLLAGGFAAGIGWLAGLVLLWTSGTWSRRDKILGTVLLPGGLLGFVFLLAWGGSTTTCSTGSSTAVGAQAATHCTTTGLVLPPVVGILVILALLVLPIVTAVRLEAVRRRA